jgi:3-oxoacyl-[acyl-carrier-protein] synthase III
MLFPSTACLVQHKIGATHAWGFDVSAACSAFNYALTVGSQMVAAGAATHVLVIGADVMSSIIDYTDRATCILFGDGAGAVVLGASTDLHAGIIDFEHEIDGGGGDALCMPAGGSRRPASAETVAERLHFVKQDGQTVFKFAVRRTAELCERLLAAQQPDGRRRGSVRVAPGQSAHHPVGGRQDRHGRAQGDHQHRSLRQHHGRDHSAGARRRGRGRPAQEGRPVLLASVGAGFTVGAVLVRWVMSFTVLSLATNSR